MVYLYIYVCMYNGTNVTAGSNVGNKKNYRTRIFLSSSFIHPIRG